MGEAFLTRRGGGAASGGVKGAVIGVIFPVGAFVSVSNGTKTYTSKDTDGNTAFSVEAGTWTVTAALGEDSDSKEVTVKEGDFTTVELSFNLLLYNYGDMCEAVTGGWDVLNKTAGAKVTITNQEASLNIAVAATTHDHNYGRVGPVNQIDLTDITSITLKTTVTGGYLNFNKKFGVSLSTNTNYVASIDTKEGVSEYVLDVSALEGLHYVSICGGASTGFTSSDGTWPSYRITYDVEQVYCE